MTNILVMTACLEPKHGHVALAAPRERLIEYRLSLRMWRASTDWHIYFVDNSNSPLLNQLRDEFSDETTTFLSLAGPEPELHPRGKGYAEAYMLRQVLGLVDSSVKHIAKVTGRLRVKNFGELVRSLPEVPYCSVELESSLRFCDTRLVVADRNVFAQMVDASLSMVDDGAGVYLEHAFAKAVLQQVCAGVSFVPFRVLPAYAGRSGTTGDRYDSGSARIRYLLHELVRRPIVRRNLTI